MTDSNKRDLKSNTAVAKDMLTDALKCAGGTFLVIDGLDEVEEFERGEILRCLMDLWRDCSGAGLKICISSRVENDIAGMLDSKATKIRVDSMNAAGIQTYVDNRYAKWMDCTDFLSEGQREIKALLSPVSTMAKGECSLVRFADTANGVLVYLQACFYTLASSSTTWPT